MLLKVVQQNTAILIFANSASQESEQKSFAKNSKLFNVLNQETLAKVKKTRLPYFHITEKEQVGSSFGERFINAIVKVYENGYENVITIGNDSPQLKTAHLLEANRQLQLGKTVLGPTYDGGFYLMGLHHSNFDASLFQRLPWQRFGLFNRISQLFENKDSHLFRLPVFEDIDSKKDLITLLNFTKKLSSELYSLISLLLFTNFILFSKQQKSYYNNFSHSFYNKGSPTSLITA